MPLFDHVPNIRRARDFHLYDTFGKRYLDFYQDRGRAILGHRPAGLSLAIKSTIDKGLYAPLGSGGYEKRLERALSRIFANLKGVRIFRNEERARTALARLFPCKTDENCIIDILDRRSTAETDAAILWRPFLSFDRLPQVFVPLLPFPGGFSPIPLCFSEDYSGPLPAGDRVSPVLLAGLVKVTFDLFKVLNARNEREKRESAYPAFDKGPWVRKGPYLLFSLSAEEYEKLFLRMLSFGIFLPPEYPACGIIPGEFTSGEIKPMIEL